MISPQNKDEKPFKWAVITALNHKEIRKDDQCISRLRPYEKQYNCKGLQFPVSIKKINKFEKSNSDIEVNMLFSNKKSQNIYTALYVCMYVCMYLCIYIYIYTFAFA